MRAGSAGRWFRTRTFRFMLASGCDGLIVEPERGVTKRRSAAPSRPWASSASVRVRPLCQRRGLCVRGRRRRRRAIEAPRARPLPEVRFPKRCSGLHDEHRREAPRALADKRIGASSEVQARRALTPTCPRVAVAPTVHRAAVRRRTPHARARCGTRRLVARQARLGWSRARATPRATHRIDSG